MFIRMCMMRKCVAIMQLFTIAIGSFLVFAMEPLVGRTLLAAFGGIAAVWVTCLVAFQILLVFGYFYAHASFSKPSKAKLSVHIALLIVAAAWCAFVARYDTALAALAMFGKLPAIKTLIAVLLVCGIPFVVLSANSSLVQVLAGGDYRLYAVGNLGSLLGLIVYPLFIEPKLSLESQWIGLAAGMAIYALAVGVLTAFGKTTAPETDRAITSSNAHIGRFSPLAWFALSAASCFLLNAVTAHLTGNVAPIPLLWAGLLAIYLLSYIIGFSTVGAKGEAVFAVIGGFFCLACCMIFRNNGGSSEDVFIHNLEIAGGALFFGATAIHARLYNLRPGAESLTGYYLLIAIGGAFGGLLSGILCPIFASYVIEYPIGLAIALAVCLWVVYDGLKAYHNKFADIFKYDPSPLHFVVAFAIVALIMFFAMCVPERGVLARGRSFYGVWRIKEEIVTNDLGKKFDVYEFFHGGTMHGLEPKDAHYRGEPTAYFGKLAGGLSFTTHPEYNIRGLRSGVIGLGIGVLDWYERPQDAIDFFEICPEVIKVAKSDKYFDFVANHKGSGQIICGDARTILEEQRNDNAPKYDVLVVDAYSGDSIPYHLITKEAFHLYQDRIADGGTLALHISNWNIDLFPIVKAAAKDLGLSAAIIAGPDGNFTIYSNWAFLSKEPLTFPKEVPHLDMSTVRDVELPCDRKGSLIDFVKWK